MICAALLACCAMSVRAQQQTPPTEQTVELGSRAMAFDQQGAQAIAGQLRTTDLRGSQDAPVRNVRLVVENVNQNFYNYVSGWITFYDAGGVRCGEGLFKVDALAPGESAETDTPGLRLTCAPARWRIVATNLLTRVGDTAKPNQPAPLPETATQAATQPQPSAPAFVTVTIDGHDYQVPMNSTLEVPVKRKGGRVKVTVRSAPQ
ncbi:MAG: hypothetical protein AUG51_22775 [Acidobacteria bacterium 13_1_20CM_3_53_8]|nr:MAG: hypothetical protein AUG51_22775 [Acidobacteria bacterium 13_1_20CM_3_53_8]